MSHRLRTRRREDKAAKAAREELGAERPLAAQPPSAEERRLEALLQATPDGVVVFGPAGEVLAANPRFAELYGIPENEVYQLGLDAYRRLVLARVSSEARPAVQAKMECAASDPRCTLELELALGQPEGRIVWMYSAPVTDPEGRLVGRVALHRDVTDKRRLEQEIAERAELPNVNPFPIFMCDAEGRVRFMNLAAENLLAALGLPRERATELFPADYREQIRAVLERRAGIFGLLHEHAERSFSLTFSPDPRRPECMVVLEDVTEHRRADEKVKRYAAELEAANREIREAQAALVQSEKMASLGNLVAGVAHEINTPVGSINSNSDVMSRALEKLRASLALAPPEASENRELLRTLGILEEIARVNRTASERIVKIVRSLRNFARLDEAERKKASLHEGLESTLTLVHHELKNRIRVVRDYGDVPEIECFPNQLNQVFMNMLVNAAHAIPEKGTITITTRSDGKNVTVAFSDTGTGISPEHLPKIFDPGFTTKGFGVGSGLGLAICYKIVRDHGGRIDVETERGKGTTFTVSLPVT